MSLNCSFVPYAATGFFSELVTDYLRADEKLAGFRRYAPDRDGLEKAIHARKNKKVNRELLVAALRRQYGEMKMPGKVQSHIDLLERETTWTICTAHQPNLLTGYLYFVYKILHAVRLAEYCKQHFPDFDFVPVYYMGSEDNDLAELGAFRYEGQQYVWDGGGQQGAVGRMQTETLRPLLDKLFGEMGPPGSFLEELRALLETAYLHHSNISSATRYLVNELFGRYGLLVVDGDDPSLKQTFTSVMKDDLLHQTAFKIVKQQAAQLAQHYKVQAQPRPINLFYLSHQLRERIEKVEDKWQVLNSEKHWNFETLEHEVQQSPESFSPNVILRGLYQETILPDIAFIGGGSELAYWLELKPLFDHYNIFFPAIFLRQSVLWIPKKEGDLRAELDISPEELFLPVEEIKTRFARRNTDATLDLKKEKKELDALLSGVTKKAMNIDATLKASSEAALAKMRSHMEVLENKMLRAEKRKMEVSMRRIKKLKDHLFPGDSLQERRENFIFLYLRYGKEMMDALIGCIDPLGRELLLIEER